MTDRKPYECDAIRLLIDLSDALPAWLDDMPAGEKLFKNMAPKFYERLKGKINDPALMKKIDDEMSLASNEKGTPGYSKELFKSKGTLTWTMAVETMRDAIHLNEQARDAFMGTNEHSKEIFHAMKLMGEEVYDAKMALEILYSDITCTKER